MSRAPRVSRASPCLHEVRPSGRPLACLAVAARYEGMQAVDSDVVAPKVTTPNFSHSEKRPTIAYFVFQQIQGGPQII